MEIMVHLINGMAVGIEYVPQVDEEEPDVRCVVLDLLVVRFMCFF